MSGCCGEPGCKRRAPIHIVLADFSGTVYAVTRATLFRRHGEGRATMRMIERHQVTDQLREFLLREREWVEKVLSEGEGDEI